jgi:hypothetical protein
MPLSPNLNKQTFPKAIFNAPQLLTLNYMEKSEIGSVKLFCCVDHNTCTCQIPLAAAKEWSELFFCSVNHNLPQT